VLEGKGIWPGPQPARVCPDTSSEPKRPTMAAKEAPLRKGGRK